MFKRLRNKFILLNMILITVVMAAAFTVVYITTYMTVNRENRSRLDTSRAAQTVTWGGGLYATFNGLARPHTVEPGRMIAPNDHIITFNVLLDSDAVILSSHSFAEISTELCEQAVALALNTERESAQITVGGREWLFVKEAMTVFSFVEAPKMFGATAIDRYTQISFLDVTESRQILTQLLVTFAIIGFVTLFAIFGISVFFARRAVAPVEGAFTRQRQFIADASHELRTPIAAIAANADAMLSDGAESAEGGKWLGYIKDETDRMGRLVNDMLYLATTDSADGVAAVEDIPVDISAAVAGVVMASEAVIYESGLTLIQNVEPEIIITCDGERFVQAVRILIDNAVKYTGRSGEITISLKRGGRHAVFSIKNTGDGIPPESIGKIFDRFYRADASRARGDGTGASLPGGYGLGLSIAKSAIEGMGGKIWAESVHGEWAAFTIVI